MAASGPAGRPRGRPAASVGQEELRRLMRAKQREAAAGKKKRVDSPFARYNSLGNLSCSLCNMPVKSELLWQTHVLGKPHKEKVEQLRNLKQSIPGPIPDTSSSLKRKTTNTESPELKKPKDSSDHPQTHSSGLPVDFFGKNEEAEAEKHSEEEEEEAEEMAKEIQDNSSKPPLSSTVQHTETPAHPPKVDTTALPSDYSDNKTLAAPLVSHSGSIQKAEIQEKVVERKENTAEALPEGFFDDPEVDAKKRLSHAGHVTRKLSADKHRLPRPVKRDEHHNPRVVREVRKVDAPKDQMDKEWDEFQKAMRQVNTISEAIVAEEDEEGRLDRQIGEIDEQIECFRRVEQLRDRQEVLKDKLKEAMRLRAAQVEDGDTGSDDEGELHDLLSQDWRAKGTSL